MDTNSVYLFYSLVLVSLIALIWVFIRLGKEANHLGNGVTQGKRQQRVEENGEEG